MPDWELHTSEEIGRLINTGMDLAILPVGATEQHGPHLGTGTDTISAQWVARQAAGRTGVLVLPPIAYGCSLGHTDRWPGTISLNPITLTTLVLEVARWALKSGIRKLIFFFRPCDKTAHRSRVRCCNFDSNIPRRDSVNSAFGRYRRASMPCTRATESMSMRIARRPPC